MASADDRGPESCAVVPRQVARSGQQRLARAAARCAGHDATSSRCAVWSGLRVLETFRHLVVPSMPPARSWRGIMARDVRTRSGAHEGHPNAVVARAAPRRRRWRRLLVPSTPTACSSPPMKSRLSWRRRSPRPLVHDRALDMTSTARTRVLLSPPTRAARFGPDSFFPHLRAVRRWASGRMCCTCPGSASISILPRTSCLRAGRRRPADAPSSPKCGAAGAGTGGKSDDDRRGVGGPLGRSPHSTEAALGRYADGGDRDSTALMAQRRGARRGPRRSRQTYSPKVFIPLTHLCRDVCHYCTFARPPGRGEPVYLDSRRGAGVARAGAAAGCRRRSSPWATSPNCATAPRATRWPPRSRVDAVLPRRDVWPGAAKRPASCRTQPGVMGRRRCRPCARSLRVRGSCSKVLPSACARRGGPHYRSPDKRPELRLDTIAAAGSAGVPFTSGILIGIGETRLERIEALLALNDCTSAGVTSRKSSSRTSAPSRTPAWRMRRSRLSTNCLDHRRRAVAFRTGHEPPSAAEPHRPL